jgi:hypothetical protein
VEKKKVHDNSTIEASKDQISVDVEGEVVLLNLKSGIYYGLEGVGARIWNLIQSPKVISEIEEVILREYEVNTESCKFDLNNFIQKLRAEGLIEIKDGAHA